MLIILHFVIDSFNLVIMEASTNDFGALSLAIPTATQMQAGYVLE